MQAWLALGVVLLFVELAIPIPTAFIAFAAGLSALLVALLTLVMANVAVQVVVWLLLSVLFVWLSRLLIPKESALLKDATEAVTLTEIPAGRAGRVRYEGSSWSARCDDPGLAIAPDQKVYVIARRGTTLVVLPSQLVEL
ncbi:NfeD family protein [Leptolyngbya sp. FACHB-261]|uniref:NfeD family protein n=1 Tax=Leptolyngbya sp. FACHB-261 TaxID=2692806 RepID=UPI001686D752|nr:NfeD family protein [Leptolyngbya sp. FACHB-261]MBD2101203.1 NfeD family protein [Leptolyngbya sp. FACHB-261]